ncbi:MULTISPECIES: FAD-dependent oxidoreductase [Modicisalibacter]|uniref:FAD-dependent oxidoreductase n=1 Tax=Modicisalibacter TaxID=574347 RepID=UPI001396BA26|nr:MULTISPECIES: FAD-dependent oxidoreductase [Halomonadaceae]MBZ9560227.1 FAD-dependent oxidoreductase [Modicisalibacter sp. R2A 31.J]MBZ9576135.1 FAD-dependent oxidoreductase [Modicisalibacter sp. MOD 31.J]
MDETTNIVLVGAGHAHLHLAARVERLIERGAHVTLISPGDFWYSGMASGMLGGDYRDDEDRLDPAALIRAGGGEVIDDRVVGIDRQARQLRLAESPPLAYDLLSLNLGSRVATNAIIGIGGDAHVWPAKPVGRLWRLRQLLETALAEQAPLPRLAVIGGGPTGVELTANLLGLGERYGRELEISLVSASERLLPEAPRSASRWVARRLYRRGARLELAASAVAWEPGRLRLDDGSEVGADHVLLASGLVAPDLVGELGLRSDARQGLAITPALHAPEDPRIFAVGDCAWLEHAPYPKLGVFGVRQGPVLLANLEARLTGAAPRHFQPQRRYLSILNLGDGRGLGLWGRFWWRGRSALALKRRLDHRFMAAYRAGTGR